MRIFITGATGLIGVPLVRTLLTQQHTITILTRSVASAQSKFAQQVSYCSSLDQLDSLDGYDAVINLAGESIGDKRWTDEQKKRLEQSRWVITQRLSDLIRKSKNPPAIFISGSAVGYYGDQGEQIINEETRSNGGFTASLCQKWEEYAMQAQSSFTRVCVLRTCIVLDREGGMLPKMIVPFRYALGSIMGSGRQYMSWIHLEDMVSAISFLLNQPNAEGAFNMGAPFAVTNREFSHALARAMHRPCLLWLPTFMVKLIMGEAAVLVLDSQRATPDKLLQLGFSFKYPQIDQALSAIMQR